MPDSTTNPEESGIKKSSPTFVQIPIYLLLYVRSLKLTGTQYDLLLFLWQYDPFGDRWVDIPPPAEIAKELEVDARTIQRAARRLIDCGLFDFQIDQWKCRNTTVSVKLHNRSTGRTIRSQTSRSNCGQADPIADKKIQLPLVGSEDPPESLKTLPDEGSKLPHTLHTDTDSLINNGERKQKSSEENSQFFLPSGEVSPSYREWLLNRANNLPKYPALIERWIESQSRAEANQKDFLNCLSAKNTTNVSLPAPNLFQIEAACSAAICNGDRGFARYKLQELWDNGSIELLKQLCKEHQKWDFVVTSTGVEDMQ